jgi:hypothetical protein
MTTYGYCDVNGGGPYFDPGPIGVPTPIPPTVSLGFVDTVDPYNPIVAVDVTSNDPCDPVSQVILEVNGSTEDFMSYTGMGRYQLHLSAIGNFGDGNVSLKGKACSGTGVCGEIAATMMRYTQSPNTAEATLTAMWPVAGRYGPVFRSANYGHGLRQVYTTTTFTCSERGENSHVQLKDSLVTISGYDPMPMWSAGVQTSGTINLSSYGLTDSANPVGCTFPVTCSSKAGSSSGTFGYAPSVHESISSFIVDGQAALITNGSLDISFP